MRTFFAKTGLAAAVLLAAPALSLAKVAERVVTLAPHVTELVYAAGGGDKLVATVSSSNYPPAALTLPRVGDGLSINAEQLLALKPDLIIGWQNTLALQKLIPTLTRLGIPVTYSEPRQLDDIMTHIEQIGQRLGTAGAAERQANRLRKELAALRDTYAQRAPVSVFIEVGTDPLYTPGDDTLTNDAIATCGGVNVFGASPLVAPAVTVESVLAKKPQAIIVAHGDARRMAQRHAYWTALQAGAALRGHVYGIDADMLLRPGPRLIQATRELCEYLDKVRTRF